MQQVKDAPHWPLYCQVWKCHGIGHKTTNCKAIRANLQPVNIVCHHCGEKGHYKIQCTNRNVDYPAHARAYVMGDGDAPRNLDVFTGTFIINQHSANVLFDSGADRSFVDTTFAHLLNIAPTKLDITYEIEMANGILISTNIVLLGCTITL